MAAETATAFNNLGNSVKNENNITNKLKDKGSKFASSNGKLTAARTQPELFCHCPQKCKNKLPQENWNALFTQFHDMGDQNRQNQFLQSHIVIKAVHLHKWENDELLTSKRRVTCRYQVPLLTGNSKLDEYVKKRGNNNIEVCQKAFMNCFGITEKRVRMQRERCISRLAPGHYKHSPFGKKHGNTNCKVNNDISIGQNSKLVYSLNDSPLDLTSDKKSDKMLDEKKKQICSGADDSGSEDNDSNQPLDLSHSKITGLQPTDSGPMKMDVDMNKLYELAEKFGVSRDSIDKEMIQKYEQLVRQNLRKQQKILAKIKKKCFYGEYIGNYNQTEIENRSPLIKVPAYKDDVTIVPVETFNNGDLTITPVLGSVSKPVGSTDIMRVNSFFQNQLWKPEHLGLSSWHKLKSQSFDA